MKLVLWGAGGHGKVVLDIARASDRYSAIAFVDDNWDHKQKEFCGCMFLGSFRDLEAPGAPGRDFILVAIGSNQVRARCFEFARRQGWEAATLVHPTAIVSPSARLGMGTVVMPRVVVNAGAEIGDNCILNTGAIVEHDCRVGDHVHLSPGVVLGGSVTVHSFVHMGLSSVALPGAVIGEGAVAGAGAVVLRAAPPWSTVVGLPARPLAGRKHSLGVMERMDEHTSLLS
jgi:acetyltransferase EpsM